MSHAKTLASFSAPGVSECTQIVSQPTGMSLPPTERTRPSRKARRLRSGRLLRIDGVMFARDDQRAIIGIIEIGIELAEENDAARLIDARAWRNLHADAPAP